MKNQFNKKMIRILQSYTKIFNFFHLVNIMTKDKVDLDLKTELDSKLFIERYKRRIRTLILLNDLTRLRLILLLIVFRKLSLTELSTYLGRVKSTTTHHLKKFDDIITTSTKSLRGTAESNMYKLIPDFLEKLKVNTDDLKNIEKKNDQNLLHYIIQNDIKFFDLIINFFDLIKRVYEFIDDSNVAEKSDSNNKIQNLYLNNRVNYNTWFLTEKGKTSYDKLIKEFNDRMQKIIEEEEEIDINNPRSYLVFNALVPLEKMIQFDPNSVFKFFSIM